MACARSRSGSRVGAECVPERLKEELVAAVGSAAEPAGEKVVEDAKSSPQALKRRDLFKGLAARLKSGPSQTSVNQGFFAASGVALFRS
jgi:hypothetical protein